MKKKKNIVRSALALPQFELSTVIKTPNPVEVRSSDPLTSPHSTLSAVTSIYVKGYIMKSSVPRDWAERAYAIEGAINLARSVDEGDQLHNYQR